jgi:hypothetical protein
MVTLQGQPADSSKVQDIKRFFKILKLEELYSSDIRNNIELQKRANPQIPAEYWPEFEKRFKISEYIDRVVPIYDKHFSHEEIKAWISFFESPAGQSYLSKQSIVLEESGVVGKEYVQEIGAPILERLGKKH